MKDEKFYSRALELNPQNAVEYYLGRAEFYCKEKNYSLAYKDFLFVKELGKDVSKKCKYQLCLDYINADEQIKKLSEDIEHDRYNLYNYKKRIYFALLKNDFSLVYSDIAKLIELNPCIETYNYINDVCSQIKEYTMHNLIKYSSRKELINSYKQRIEYAKEKIILHDNYEYWQYRAERDLDEIYNLVKDKALGLYLKVNFYEDIKNIGNAIFYAKQVVEESKKQRNKTLTYLYATKLIALYSGEEEFKKALEIAAYYPDKPTSEELKKGLKYINNFAYMNVDVLRDNVRTRIKHKKKGNE